MRGWKKGVSAVLAAALILTALPVNGISQVNAADGTEDATVKMIPGEASTFNDTDYDGLGEFQGWGTSLCWWANRLGYSEKLTSEAAAKFYGNDGLKMNISRYNVGGGDNVVGGEYAEDNKFLHDAHIERSDSMVPGYCKNVTEMDLTAHDLAYYQENYDRADETSGYAWNYNWEADHRQLAILKAAKETSGEEFIAEAFSNSPPYFMTNSGCSSGAENSNKDNLRTDCYKAFAAYMADVVVHWAEVGFVDFTSTTPMNEPYTNYWGKNSKKQEGCHFDQGDSESNILIEYNAELQRQLKETTNENVKRVLSNLIICGTDETSIDTAITSYNKLSDEAKNVIQRIDTHTYGGSKRAELCALAEREGKNLWMSEIDRGYMAGENPGEMGCPLEFAQRIITDLNGLKASAWIMWNAIDVHIDADESRRSERFDAKESIEEMKTLTYDDNTIMYDPAKYGYWGIAIADHNKGEIILTKKYYAYGQFSRYIRPGYTIMGTSDKANTLIAYDPKGKKTVIVAVNPTASNKTWKFDLSEYKTMGSTVKAYRTSGPTDGGEDWADVTANASIKADTTNRSVTADLLANSITTFVVEGTEYDIEQNYESAEKPIKDAIQTEVYAQNDSLMQANMDNVEKVSLSTDMVTGSTPWNNGTKDIPQNVVDGKFDTFFDGVADGWVQIDLGTQENIAGFGYAPRKSYADRCVGASFYGSNDGQNWTKLYTISDTPSQGALTNVYASRFDTPNNTSYRYIKYAVPVGDSGAACNVAEIAVYRWKSGTNVTFREMPQDDLQGWVAYYKNQTEGNDYIVDGWLTFRSAMKTAENLLSSGSTDTGEVSRARRALAVAYLELQPGTEADRLQLPKAILQDGISKNMIEDSRENEYTKSSWDAYQSKLTEAKNLLNEETLTEAQADEAVSKLAVAYLGLVLDETEPAKTILRDEIAKNTVADSKKSQYTKSSWDNYQGKLTAAKNLLDEETLTVAQANQAVSDLKDAKDALDQKKNQTITCTKTFTKAYGDKAFKLNAKVKTGNGTLSYKSSDEKVAKPDKSGKVTIKGIGSCTITITASDTDNYNKATKKVTITVNPKQISGVKATPGKKSLKVTWKKDAKATGYEIQCCLKKNFKSGVKKAKVTKAKTTSTTFKKLKKGKKYYVRIRAYKSVKVGKKTSTFTGAWSKVVQSKKIK